MCGIVGYIGSKECKEILLSGLRELEYRGYDSAGIAVMQGQDVRIFKEVGKLVNLEKASTAFHSKGFSVGIGHTRWATHGKPTVPNAHPHSGELSFVVHNGIIENHASLKEQLVVDGYKFSSETDTEVIVHLFEKNLKLLGDVFKAFEQTAETLEGAFAVLLITKAVPDRIFFVKKGSPPLLIGIDSASKEKFFASSEAALIGHANQALFLRDGEYGWVDPNELCIMCKGKDCAAPEYKKLDSEKLTAQKEGYRYFMEKEIYEQNTVLIDTMMGRFDETGVRFDELAKGFFDGIEEIRLCACGTSFHAALSASYLFERLSKIRSSAEIASEFRYKEPFMSPKTLFVVISQSGETADTLEALKIAKNAGLKTLAICNVDNSSIVREADAAILTRAGIEKGVASTKAFATQLMVLWMLAFKLAKEKNTLGKEALKKEFEAIRAAKDACKVSKKMHDKIKRLSKRYLHGHGFFFIGRDLFYPLALEGALKLKEISYLHAEGYPAGEMKHGPIALADAELFTVALMPKNMLFDKIKSNVEELSARDSTIVAVSPDEVEIADDFIKTEPRAHYMEEFYEMMVIVQLLALEIAVRLGNDVDMPRNLAKSVTVE